MYTTLMALNEMRWKDWFAAGLLLSALVTAAMRLEITEWTANLQIIEILTLLGGIFGLMLGASRFRPSLAQVFALYYTLFFVFWQIGIWMEENLEWPVRFTSIILRLLSSIAEVAQGKPIYDPILFLTTMSFLFWIVSIIAGYQLTRYGKPWVALFVAGLVLLIIDFYAPYDKTRDRYSAIFVFFSLLLAARMYLLNARRDWNTGNVVVDPEIGYDLGRSVAVAGLALVLVAWNIPNLVQALTPGTQLQKDLANKWETVRDKVQNSVAGLKSPVVVVSDFFGRDMGLGTGGTLSDEIVFTVQLPTSRPENVRFYWRARSYDTYIDGQWQSSTDTSRLVKGGEWPFLYPEWKARKEVNLTITPVLASIRNLYSPGVPLSFSRPADVISRLSADGTSDVVGAVANPALHAGEIFRVKAWISTPNINMLRQSGWEYPDLIKSYYLQLPENFSSSVQELARQVVGNLDNPYDQVMAVTNYLRSTITYSEVVPIPPKDRDPVEWFLFDLKRGFCNYYASAEVLMLRSIGIPARLAVGYAEGESEIEGDFFQIRRRDSHAWPEVYFNEIGWVEFEPTTALPVIEHPEAIEASPEMIATLDATRAAGGMVPRGEERADEIDSEGIGRGSVAQNPLLYLLSVVIPVALLLLAGFLLYPRLSALPIFKAPLPVTLEKSLEDRGISAPGWLHLWARHSELSPMEKLYSRINWLLIFLRIKTAPGDTAAEKVNGLVKDNPANQAPAEIFLDEYQLEEYSPRRGDYDRAVSAANDLVRNSLKKFIARLVKV